MAKLKTSPQPNELQHETDFGRGEIKDNALKAVVYSITVVFKKYRSGIISE